MSLPRRLLLVLATLVAASAVVVAVQASAASPAKAQQASTLVYQCTATLTVQLTNIFGQPVATPTYQTNVQVVADGKLANYESESVVDDLDARRGLRSYFEYRDLGIERAARAVMASRSLEIRLRSRSSGGVWTR
jgi:hypothetical protein